MSESTANEHDSFLVSNLLTEKTVTREAVCDPVKLRDISPHIRLALVQTQVRETLQFALLVLCGFGFRKAAAFDV